MTRLPHYVRFARALALAGGLATVGCNQPVFEGDGGFDAGRDAGGDGGLVADAGSDAGTDGGQDAGLTCSDCACVPVDSGMPQCDSVNLSFCCFAVGPLQPPDMPA